MAYNSVILPCPDALFVWFEERLTTDTVEQAMLAVLSDWQRMQTAHQANEVRSRDYLAARLTEEAVPLELPPPEPARVLPAVRKGTGAKYRKKPSGRHQRR